MFYRIIPIVLILCLFPVFLFAQQDQIQFSRIDIANGLSHNQVNAILKDKKGLMWFGTLSGLNRYDGYQFRVFKHDPRDTTSLTDDFITNIYELPDNALYLETRSGPNIYRPGSENFIRNVKPYLHGLHINAKLIRDILKDRDGNFWFNADKEGLFKYNPVTRKTVHLFLNRETKASSSDIGISVLQQDLKGNIWVMYLDKTIEMLDRKSGKVLKRIDLFKQQKEQLYQLFVDNAGALWIYTLNIMEGINYFDPATGEKRFIDKGKGGLNNNLISLIVQDANGLIWIGTDHGGVNLLDKRNFKIRYLVNNEYDPKSIGQNSVLTLYKDGSGIMWVGTFKKGLSFYHEKILKFPLYRHRGGNGGGIAYEDINRFAEDDMGNIWIGTNGGGLFYYNRMKGSFKRFVHEPENRNSLSNDIIVSLYIDRKKVLWIGTYFGGLDRFDGASFKHYKHSESNAGSLADDRVWDILEDHKGNLWVATLNGGLDKLDRATGVFTHNRSGKANSVKSDYISCLIEDREGNLWIGTSNGIDKLNINGRFSHYQNKAVQPNSLINNIVYDLMQDSYGFIWVATRDGISRLDPKTGDFRNFDGKDGLTERATLKILEDANRNLWLSTANGLFNILVTKGKNGSFSYAFRRFDAQDGLQGSAFNANAGFKTRAGELLFGGANGFNLFQPQHIKNDKVKPLIILTGLEIANRPVMIGEKIDGRVILKESVALTKELELRYNQNGFTIAFAALNYFNPQKIRYKYKLEGFDHHWQELQRDNRRAAYTNIDPGNYVFKVISTDASGNWVNNETRLQVTVLPPFWRSYFAYILYICAIGGTLHLIRRRGIRKIKKEFLIEQERQQSKRMHELDVLKIKFLTNVSHEFRTPLSLIISPMEKLIRNAPDAQKQQLQLIQRNGRRLLNLVNQLLDFRKMEVQELRLHPKTGDIVQFIQELSYSFTDVAERKGIALQFSTDKQSLITVFDHDKIERILFNLLSNAFKFTTQGGMVKVILEVTCLEQGGAQLRMKVIDSGIGIAADKLEKIFDRFFQDEIPDSLVNQGSGIGLSITREFVKLHGGTILVESQLNEGTTFQVTLFFAAEQIGKALETADLLNFPYPVIDQLNSPETLLNARHKEIVNSEFAWKSKKPVLVLVEDHEDFRFYLKDNLKEYYQIVEAGNGREGWQKILSMHPDLIVSDVSMPEMNGIDLCKKVKSDSRTAHIPVILLTALTTEDQQLTGLETGASDYMTKPFNFEILLSKIRNLLQQQATAKKTYRKQLEFKPALSEIESVDDKFIRQLAMHIEKHLSDPDYTVDQLSADMNMSRVGLYKKILPLTGKSPIEYIRSYRLKKSKPLLLKSQLTIAEVAYQVGFSNPKHFSKCFKQEFGILPSAFAQTKEDEIKD